MQVVWIFGSSGAGKETLIQGLSRKEQPLELLKHFRWNPADILICEESLRLVAQHDNDPVLEKRKELADMIKTLAQDDSSVILIKGQDVDLEQKIPSKLKEMLPNAVHRIIFLSVPTGVLLERWKRKPWWNDEYTLKTVQQWEEYQLELLKKLQGEFVFSTVRSVDTNTYKLSDGLMISE
jgi:adenylate kinase family enzyme